MPVRKQGILDGLRGVDEQPAIKAVLFLGDPVAAAVPADKDDGRCRATRWRFDELHVGVPSGDERPGLPTPRTFRRCVVPCANVRRAIVGRKRLDSWRQYLPGAILI